MNFIKILDEIEDEFKKAKDIQELDVAFDGITDHIAVLYQNEYDKRSRKKYPFIEAFIAFEDGKIIEDKYGICYRKVDKITIEYKSKHMKEWEELYSDINIFSIDAIKGDWYINS